jgi:hypothetical protein
MNYLELMCRVDYPVDGPLKPLDIMLALPLRLTSLDIESQGYHITAPAMFHLGRMSLVSVRLKHILLVFDAQPFHELVFPKLTSFVYEHTAAGPGMGQFLGRCVPSLRDLECHGPRSLLPRCLALTRLLLVHSPSFPERLPKSLKELQMLNVFDLREPVEDSFLDPFRHLTCCSKLILSSVDCGVVVVVDLTMTAVS